MTWTPKHDFPFTYRLTIAYDGGHYLGWQIQPDGPTIQSKLSDVLTRILQEPISIIGSGRTDAGVHALGQVAHFRCRRQHDPHRLQRALNGLLPPDIRVVDCRSAPASFHALYTAIGKTYHYHLWLDPVHDPFLYRTSWHIRRDLDLSRMEYGARILVGTHDFSALANENRRGAAGINAVRTLKRLEIIPQRGGIRIELEADGFLYKMVRNIVGTLVNGSFVKTKHPEYIDDLAAILASRDRRRAGRAAPPHGLFLMQVYYG